MSKFYIFWQKLDHWPKKSKYWSFIQNSKDYSVVFKYSVIIYCQISKVFIMKTQCATGEKIHQNLNCAVGETFAFVVLFFTKSHLAKLFAVNKFRHLSSPTALSVKFVILVTSFTPKFYSL